MKLLTDEMEAEAENWDKYAENDIVKRAKVGEAFGVSVQFSMPIKGHVRNVL
jgi:hypothetical protein